MKQRVTFVPGMLRGKCDLHDPGDLHDPFFFDTPLLRVRSPPPAPTSAAARAALARLARAQKARALKMCVVKVSKRRKKMDVAQACAVAGCREELKLGVRNDNRHPLCESHKRAAKVQFEDGTEVSFCFYCNRTHDAHEFSLKTNICDRQYARRRDKRTTPPPSLSDAASFV